MSIRALDLDLEIRDDLIALLRATDLFGGLGRADLARVVGAGELVHCGGGDVLLAQGDPGDALYIVVSGRVRVTRSTGGADVEVAELGPGEPVGELGLLDDRPRGATVRAIRDTELLRIGAEQFGLVVDRHPCVLRAMTRSVVSRLAAPGRRRQTSTVRTIAVVPAGATPRVTAFCRQLVAALERRGPVVHVRAATVARHVGSRASAARPGDPLDRQVAGWLAGLEERSKTVVYEAEPLPTPWTERCLRQADIVVLVGDAGRAPDPNEVEARLLAACAPATRRELVLIHASGASRATATAEWLRSRQVAAHHNVRRGVAADHARLARLLTGRAVGLVLGGGGPRGFAHLGALRALEEAGVPIDLVGGTSIGSIMAASYAIGWDHDMRVANALRAFVDTRRLIGPTLPVLALSSSRKLTSLLRHPQFFGDTAIEDLWTGFFCVSANLSRAETVVHDRGPAWLAMRSSISIPGVLPPVAAGGDLLVDGGVLNNLPVDVMAQRFHGGGRIVAVDLDASVDLRVAEDYDPTVSGWAIVGRRLHPFRPSLRLPGVVEVIMRSKEVGARRAQRDSLDASSIDLWLRPPVTGFPALDFKYGRRLIDIGYQSTVDHLAEHGVDGLLGG